MTERILVNGGYLLMLIALAARDVLWLRSVLALGQMSLFAFGCVAGLPPVIFWNGVFVVMNVIQVLRLLSERRPVSLPPDLADLHDAVFRAMTAREFLLFWELGQRRGVINDQLIRDGELQKDLAVVTEGKVRVVKNGQAIASLGRGSFIAEMSFITGEPASADVVADGPVRIMAWEQEKLRSLSQLNPRLLIKLQNILGQDLTRKIRASAGK